MTFFLLLNTKEDILKNVGKRTVSVPTNFHYIGKSSINVSGDYQLFVFTFFKISSFVFRRRKKLHTLKNKGASRCHRRTFWSKWFHKEALTSEEPFCFTKASLWQKKVLQIIKGKKDGSLKNL